MHESEASKGYADSRTGVERAAGGSVQLNVDMGEGRGKDVERGR